tara:strand:- start:173 stop:400 length:228 start_codon:yes stop_codon:yes gene_type:complete
MRKNIHPNYHKVKFSCSCGNEFETHTTAGKEGGTIKIEVCSACHPCWVGGHKVLDTEGRVDKFKNRFAAFGKAKK